MRHPSLVSVRVLRAVPLLAGLALQGCGSRADKPLPTRPVETIASSASALASSAPAPPTIAPSATSAAPSVSAFPPPGSTHTATRSVDRIGIASLAPDGRTLITLGVGNVVHRWDLVTGKLLGVDDPPGGPSATERAGGIAALPDRMFARCDGKALGIFRTDDGSRVRALPPARLPCGWMYASPDGRTLFVTSTKGSVDVVDAATGETRRTLRVNEGYTRIVGSPDNKAAFSLDNTNNAFVWDLTTGEKRGLGRQGFVSDAAFSPDSTEIVTLGRPAERAFVKVLSLVDLRELGRVEVPPLTRGLAYAGGEGSAVAVGGGSSGRGYLRFVTREPLVVGKTIELPSPPEPLLAATTAPVVVTVSYEAFIRVWNARTGELGGMIVPAKP